MSAALIKLLQSIADFPAPRGKRYPLWVILLLVVLGTLSGCYRYIALEEFRLRHYAALCEHLGMQVKRWLSDTTFRRILIKQAAVHQLPCCLHTEVERTCERLVERSVKVFKAHCALTRWWAKAQSLIVVQRCGT